MKVDERAGNPSGTQGRGGKRKKEEIFRVTQKIGKRKKEKEEIFRVTQKFGKMRDR